MISPIIRAIIRPITRPIVGGGVYNIALSYTLPFPAA